MLQRDFLNRRGLAIAVGAGAGIAIEAVAVAAAMFSGGAGHGSYVLARLLFPFSFLLMLAGGELEPLVIGVGLLQYPLYGGLLGLASASKRMRVPVGFLALHMIAALASFSGIAANLL